MRTILEVLRLRLDAGLSERTTVQDYLARFRVSGLAWALAPPLDEVALERAFVDCAGQSVDVVDPTTGEVRPAQIFVAAPGAGNYTYAEATWTQQLPDRIASHVRRLESIGGVPVQADISSYWRSATVLEILRF